MQKICCDHCGEEIQGAGFRVVGEQKPRDGTQLYEVTDPELRILADQVENMDFCERCFGNLMKFLADTDHKLLTAAVEER